jgi:hypothetical protein
LTRLGLDTFVWSFSCVVNNATINQYATINQHAINQHATINQHAASKAEMVPTVAEYMVVNAQLFVDALEQLVVGQPVIA